MLAGATDLELAEDDTTCKAAAQFMRFTASLRANQRAKIAATALKAQMTGVELRDWQETVVDKVDKYDCLFAPTELEFIPSLNGSSFREFGVFEIHSFP